MKIDGLFAEVEKQPIYRREKTKAVFSLLTYTTVSYFKHPHLFFFVNVPVGKTDKKDK